MLLGQYQEHDLQRRVFLSAILAASIWVCIPILFTLADLYQEDKLEAPSKPPAAVTVPDIDQVLLKPVIYFSNGAFEPALYFEGPPPTTNKVNKSSLAARCQDLLHYRAHKLEIRHYVPPAVPDYDLRANQNGWVRVLLLIDPNGRVADSEVIEFSKLLFKKPVLEVSSQWSYFPPKDDDGNAISCCHEVLIVFPGVNLLPQDAPGKGQ